MNLPTLYARHSDGNKILEWNIEIEGNKYRMISGAQGFKKVISKWTIVEGKNIGRANETSPEMQAESEALSKWEKKKKSKGYWENLADIDKETFIEPMLAEKFHEKQYAVVYPCQVDIKYNGGRIVSSAAGVFTRTGEVCNTIPHIKNSIQPLIEKYPDLVLDGEAYNHEYRYKLNELMKILRKSVHFTPELLDKSERMVKYYVYDGYGFNGVTEETPCIERRKALQEFLKDIPYVVVAPYWIARDEEELFALFDQFLKDGYEGAMYRTIDGIYHHKRCNDLLKIKPSDDDEAVIVDITEGVGNFAGIGAIITLKWQDKQFNATFKGTHEQGAQFLKDKKDWIGKTVTFLYIGLTGKGVPNYARVDINNCLKK